MGVAGVAVYVVLKLIGSQYSMLHRLPGNNKEGPWH